MMYLGYCNLHFHPYVLCFVTFPYLSISFYILRCVKVSRIRPLQDISLLRLTAVRAVCAMRHEKKNLPASIPGRL